MNLYHVHCGNDDMNWEQEYNKPVRNVENGTQISATSCIMRGNKSKLLMCIAEVINFGCDHHQNSYIIVSIYYRVHMYTCTDVTCKS